MNTESSVREDCRPNLAHLHHMPLMWTRQGVQGDRSWEAPSGLCHSPRLPKALPSSRPIHTPTFPWCTWASSIMQKTPWWTCVDRAPRANAMKPAQGSSHTQIPPCAYIQLWHQSLSNKRGNWTELGHNFTHEVACTPVHYLFNFFEYIMLPILHFICVCALNSPLRQDNNLE